MIEKQLIFAKGGTGNLAPQHLNLQQARQLLDLCLRFESYLFIKPGEVTVENHTFGCYTEFRGEPDEIAALADGLREHLPPERAHSYWLDHLRNEL